MPSSEKKPVSEKQLAANRANAAKSTGPKTPEGRANSSRNSVRHGLADGFLRLARQGNGIQLFLRYQAQAERLYRRAVEEFERVKKLWPELPIEPILEDEQPAEPEENTAASPSPEPAPDEPIPGGAASPAPVAPAILSPAALQPLNPRPRPPNLWPSTLPMTRSVPFRALDSAPASFRACPWCYPNRLTFLSSSTRLALFLATASAASAQTSFLLDTLSQELNRNYSVLRQKGEPAPYFMSYEVSEQEYHSVSAMLGAIESANNAKDRILDVTVRVGTPKLDNYHSLRGNRGQFTSGALLSYEDNANAIKRRLWIDTDRAYRGAAERLIRIKTNTQVKVAAEDTSDDFSQDSAATFREPPPKLQFDEAAWSQRVRNLSSRFLNHPAILTSHVAVSGQTDTRYFASTEGAAIQHGRGFARVIISASAKATDGTDLSTGETFEAVDPAGLPKDDVLLAAVERVAKDLEALLRAPEAEPFVGPAIFSGRAAGVFFHEIFGHRIEGHRQKDESEGQTFTRSVGTKVLPDFLSVVFDPTRRKVDGIDLNGWYEYDDEGVKGRPVTAVENGVLKTFLMSRSPIQGVDHSNGHGRRQPGYEVVSRQSNLIVESSKAVPEAQLRQMLIEEIKRQNKPYGLFFRDITGGFTTTARAGLQAFKVIPVIVYRVYPDGRPDELVRGTDIVGTPLASFAKILATSDKPEVFNGYCGAESGQVPVSAVSPAILVSEIEIEKTAKSNDRPPLLPIPFDAESGAGLQPAAGLQPGARRSQ